MHTLKWNRIFYLVCRFFFSNDGKTLQVNKILIILRAAVIRAEHSTIPHNQLLSQPHRGILLLTIFLLVHTIHVDSTTTAKQMVNSWPSSSLVARKRKKWYGSVSLLAEIT